MTRRPTAALFRTPRDVCDLLAEAAENAAEAAALLVSLVETRDPRVAADLKRLEAEGDRITHDLLRAVRDRVAGADRGALLELARAIDDCVNAIEHAGHAVPEAGCGRSGRRLAGVVSDVSRTEVELVRLLSGPAEHDHWFHVDAAHALSEEGRSIVRAALGHAVGEGTEPMVALRQKTCFDELAAALDAGVRAVHTTDRAVSDL